MHNYLFPSLVAGFIGALLLMKFIGKLRARYGTGSTKEKPFSAPVQAVASTLVPILIGGVLVTVVFAYTESPKRFRKRILNTQPAPEASPTRHGPYKSKIVFFDDHKFVPVDALGVCSDEDLTVVSLGKVRCVDPSSPEGEALLSQDGVVEEVQDATPIMANDHLDTHPIRLDMFRPQVRQQSFFRAPPAKTLEEKKDAPFKDRYAEFFYFLALVAGVFGKYFQDYSEARKKAKAQGLKVEFDYTQIILSFIIGALVYYSIQEGIEKEAGKFTIRGVMFAFYNGYCWQTLLARKQVSVSSQKEKVA
jgi:hypothetical protein